MGLWDPLSTDRTGKWMSWFCGGNPLSSKSTRFFRSCTDICIPTMTANKPELTAASSVYGVYFHMSGDSTPNNLGQT